LARFVLPGGFRLNQQQGVVNLHVATAQLESVELPVMLFVDRRPGSARICEIADTDVGGWKAQTMVIYVRDGDAWKRRMVYVDKRPMHGLFPLIQDSGNSDHR